MFPSHSTLCCYLTHRMVPYINPKIRETRKIFVKLHLELCDIYNPLHNIFEFHKVSVQVLFTTSETGLDIYNKNPYKC